MGPDRKDEPRLNPQRVARGNLTQSDVMWAYDSILTQARESQDSVQMQKRWKG